MSDNAPIKLGSTKPIAPQNSSKAVTWAEPWEPNPGNGDIVPTQTPPIPTNPVPFKLDKE